jgi:hypothetical protein
MGPPNLVLGRYRAFWDPLTFLPGLSQLFNARPTNKHWLYPVRSRFSIFAVQNYNQAIA